MYTIIRNIYFKLSINNIILFKLEGFFLEKIDNNIKANALYLHFLIRKTVGVKKVNVVKYNKDIFAIIFLTTNSRKNLYF